MQEMQAERIEKIDIMAAAALFVLTLLTRVPFASRTLFEGDSARFAMAMKHYDVAQMRPHAPGYILYVAAAKFVDLFLHDTRLSLVAVSIVSSALTILILYFLAARMFGRSSGIMSGLLLASSPLFWYNGEMAFTYALEGWLSVFFAFACYRMLKGADTWLLPSAVLLGLATGVRQHIVICLLPLWLYALKRYSFKQVFLSVLVFGVTCLAWFVPMITLTGGLSRYSAAAQAQFQTWVKHPAPILFQFIGRWDVFSGFMVYSLTLGLLPMIYFLGRLFNLPDIVEDARLRFLLFWLVPPILFLIGVNVFNSGHVLIVLPPLFICLAESIRGAASDVGEAVKRLSLRRRSSVSTLPGSALSYRASLVSFVLVLVLFNTYLFLFKDTGVSYAAITKGDRNLSELVRLTREHAEPEKTVVLTFLYNTQAAFYLPEYRVYCPFPLMFSASQVPIEAQNVYMTFHYETNPKSYWIPTDFKIEPIPVPPGIETVVLWEKEITRYFQDVGRPLEEIPSEGGGARIYLFRVKPGEKIYYDYHYLSVR